MVDERHAAVFVLTQSERRGGRSAARSAGGGGRKGAIGRVDQAVEGLPPSEIGEHKGEHPLFQPRSAVGLEGEFEQHLVPARAEPDFLRRTAGEIFVEEEIFVAYGRFAGIVEARRSDEAIVEPNLCAHAIPTSGGWG